MWKFLTNAISNTRYEARFPIAADRLVYAIGDVHGRVDLLEPLLEKILTDVLTHQSEHDDNRPAEVVVHGDVVDRGPDTRQALEFLAAIQDWPEITPIYLMGNHEQMLLEFLKDPLANKRWLRYGGYETLLSYNLDLRGDLFEDRTILRVASDLSAAMGYHTDLLGKFVHSHLNGNLFFTHAGADPALPIEEQPTAALVWGVQSFMRQPRKDGFWVVHGHTVVEKPVVKDSRISIDTGAYLSGALTALKVFGSEVSFLRQTGSSSEDA
ncbi:MAG: metallophosphoesterase [Pseudomonadota bacterium]